MAEYLAPGVYVEEVSFRAKSIEGVSTSTTGFVGPTRRGPLARSPELLTSFGDFQRVYGGVYDLESPFGLNYVAHAVRAFFENGGARLYVSRVYLPTSDAVGAGISKTAGPATAVGFAARYPGAAGDGTIQVVPHFASATLRSMDRAPEGTLLRIGARNAAGPASVTGKIGPFVLQRGDNVLAIDTGPAVQTPGAAPSVKITMHGEPAEAVAPVPLPEPVNATAPATAVVVNVVVGGVAQTIRIDAGLTRAAFIDQLNQDLRGAYARLTTAAEGTADCLAIGTDVWGSDASVTVSANADIGFTTPKSGNVAPNTVRDIRNVTVDDLNALFGPAADVVASLDRAGNLVLSTKSTGATAAIAVRDGGPNSAHALLFPAPGTPTGTGTAGAALQYYFKVGSAWTPDGTTNTAADRLDLTRLQAADPPSAEFGLVSVIATDADGFAKIYDGLGLAPSHPRFIGHVLTQDPSRGADALENVFAITGTDGKTGDQIRAALLPPITDDQKTFPLTGGSDGLEPNQAAYEDALALFEQNEELSIIAAPGESSFQDHEGIQGALIAHCERPRAYRIAVLDTAADLTPDGAAEEKGRVDSTHAALYYPWVRVSNPLSRPGDASIPSEILLPPSGFVCGVYARTDVNRGVFKPPANEVVLGALRFETDINFHQQELLNPLGVNCLRLLPNRGFRVWGARTISSDPEWKYVNVRRYFNYLERSIDQGSQWAVFEPNGEKLWANITETLTSFLINEWQSGALLGDTPKEAFFVRCDRSTMDQSDLDNGRLVCLVGVAAVKPAEFVIFRIGQKTADARS